jgi:hypothetical protein
LSRARRRPARAERRRAEGARAAHRHKDEKGVGFYLRHGFIRLDKTLSLFLPLDTLRAAEKSR